MRELVHNPLSPPSDKNPRFNVGFFFSRTEPSLLERGEGKRKNEMRSIVVLQSIETPILGITSEVSNPQCHKPSQACLSEVKGKEKTRCKMMTSLDNDKKKYDFLLVFFNFETRENYVWN